MIETVMVASDLKVGLLRDVDICRYRVKTDLAVGLGCSDGLSDRSNISERMIDFEVDIPR